MDLATADKLNKETMKFCDNLRILHKASRYSHEKFAEKLGVSQEKITEWEKGESYPSIAMLGSICNVLKCQPKDLLLDISDKKAFEEGEDKDRLKRLMISHAKKKSPRKSQKNFRLICNILSVILFILQSLAALYSAYLVAYAILTMTSSPILSVFEQLKSYGVKVAVQSDSYYALSPIKQIVFSTLYTFLNAATFVLIFRIIVNVRKLIRTLRETPVIMTLGNIRTVQKITFLIFLDSIIYKGGLFAIQAFSGVNLQLSISLLYCCALAIILLFEELLKYTYRLKRDRL